MFRKSLDPYLISFMLNSNSYHVILKCISLFPENQNAQIFEVLKKNIFEICVNKCGCSSIQKLLDMISSEEKGNFIAIIIGFTNYFIENSNGNYVLLYIISLQRKEYCNNILNKIISNENFKQLCKLKIPSGIIEKCIENVDFEERKKLIDLLLNEKTIIELIIDPQGFFSIFLN